MSTTQSGAYHVGDRVAFDYGRGTVTGVIVEDHGAIGVKGQRLFQVQVPMEPDEPLLVELAEDEIRPAPSTDPGPSVDPAKAVEYLANGGLISLLRANRAGGKNQPRAWLCPDVLGNVTHTFVPERGVVGGQLVPFGAVHDDKVFAPRRDAVLTFLESFGLGRAAAERVLATVGTAP